MRAKCNKHVGSHAGELCAWPRVKYWALLLLALVTANGSMVMILLFCSAGHCDFYCSGLVQSYLNTFFFSALFQKTKKQKKV